MQRMTRKEYLHNGYDDKFKRKTLRFRWYRLHLDGILLLGIFVLATLGIVILYSASNQNLPMVDKQAARLLTAIIVMIACAQISPHRYFQWAPWLFSACVFLLLAVLIIGKVDKGARRWIDLGVIRFQPSEVMKLAMPFMLAWFFDDKPLPPRAKDILIAAFMLAVPVLLTAKEPDLGTAVLIALSGGSVLVLAGINWKYLAGLFTTMIISAPVLWHFMHQYQKDRVLTFINPERDPLGTGYHIIQSKIAIGSGGIFGKGYLQGTQSHLQFLPAHATDFIFAVNGEEFGLIGAVVLLAVFLLVTLRCIYISANAQTTFTRLLAGSLSFTFILSALINIGMVIGILPVVGVPLPLISYGGTSMVTMMAAFGIIMSIHTHKKLLSS
jgi:rod shape determining protein RodA